ncbi:CGNR zinc finger domain-containing protein [Alicyclobacillus sp. SO9]|uniref:CGNR zinc finger domain-containing protein n=1 Tax=Alicyclobacillus sp. SO9 TaxID=2665646 RepID=UPI0018E738E8|nr:CGNR zinc finger domain-containing protein [Alicyclobacillus sp. SO9]QQE80447.1 CGNR zinc finger domain-containing protein [Alicyclobacillus sp. SO9]
MKTTGPLVEGNLAIDFVNTEEIRRGIRKDYIDTADTFSVWLTDEELEGAVSKEQLPFEVEIWPEEAMGKVHELREEIRDNVEQTAECEEVGPRFVKQMESYIEKAPFAMKLHEGRVVHVPVGDPVEKLCSLVAADVLRMIGEGQLEHVRKCANPECLFMFVDRAGRRKWCSMRRCGNRAKVTRHLKRQAGGD